MADIEHSALLATLDLKSKVALLTGASMFTLAPEASIGLTEIRLSDAGVRGLKFSGGPQAALFPNATLLAAAWSEQTAYEVGRLLAEEAMAQRIHVVLGPNINLHRSPLGGRLFEAYSEDPLLTGRLAAAYVRGLQDLGVGACLKHLVANESETERNTVNCVVDEATLREVYLLPFEIAVHDADPWSMMAAYNDVNGVPATEQDHVINGIVKGEWGYAGLVMSDWFATKSTGPAANGGLDRTARAVGRRAGRRRAGRGRAGGGRRRARTPAAGARRTRRRVGAAARLPGNPSRAGQPAASAAVDPARGRGDDGADQPRQRPAAGA